MEREFQKSGNFLLQALLALALIAAFIPVVVRRAANEFSDTTMAAAASQISEIADAGMEYFRNAKIPNGAQNFSGARLVSVLSEYGLPDGFDTHTSLGGDISMFVYRNAEHRVALLEISDVPMSDLRRRDLMQRIGPAAGVSDDDNIITGVLGDWKIDMEAMGFRVDKTSIYLRLDDDEFFSELLRIVGDKQKFLTDLEMGGNDISGAKMVVATTAKITNATTANINVSSAGTQTIREFIANRATSNGPVSFGNSAVSVGAASTDTVSAFGMFGGLEADEIFIDNFNMAPNAHGFSGGENWRVSGNMSVKNFNLNIDAVEISGMLNVANTPDIITGEIWQRGITATTLNASFVSLRDVFATQYLDGNGGGVVSEIRPAGVSIFWDVIVGTINNDEISIIKNPMESDSTLITCKDAIRQISSVDYQSGSLAQNIVCRYMFWHALEQRINEKCRLDGKC